MNKFRSRLKIKFLLIFFLTVVLGLWFGGGFDRYVFSFGFSESFSQAEVQILIGKQVLNACQPKPDSEIAGKIVGFSKADFSEIYANIVWEETGDKIHPTGFSKGAFKQCIKFINEN